MILPVLDPLDARIPRWDLKHLAVRLCPFCESENEAVLKRPDQLPVAPCNTCGCWYVGKLPSAAEIKKLYDGYYHAHRPADLSEKNVSRMLANACRASQTDWQLHTLAQLLGGMNNKRILDVGCGWGNFLLMAKALGALVAGCDLSPEACEFARNRLGLTVHQSELDSYPSAIGNIDAVVMRDFIEHPVNPLVDIQAACNILKPGGLLLLYTPNGGDAGTSLETGKNWVGFRVDLEHLQYLSPRTINWLSRKLGVRIERLETLGYPVLEGIDGLPQLPNSRHRVAYSAREMVKMIPGMRKTVQALRLLKAKITGQYRDPLLGSYHLFTILRKV